MRAFSLGRPLRAAVCLLLLLGAASSGASRLVEDWDFTPTDYGTLTSGGGDLDFDADSDWVPANVKDNLKRTLKKVLDPNTTPPMTTGVNLRDFYHGHICCHCDSGMSTKKTAFWEHLEQLEGEALGGNWFDPVTADNLAAFSAAKRQVEREAGQLLRDWVKDDCYIIYHTFETNTPDGMEPGDARRNIRTPMKAGEPPAGVAGHEALNCGIGGACEVLQFCFLIDERGKIHVSVGTRNNLCRVTGRPE